MQELMESMVRFSTAMTLFGLQQVQNVIDLSSDSKAAHRKFRTGLDAISDALTEQLDESKRKAVDSASKLVDTTYDAFPVLDPGTLVDNVTDVIRKTADTMSDAISRASKKTEKDEAEEPVNASTILTAES